MKYKISTSKACTDFIGAKNAEALTKSLYCNRDLTQWDTPDRKLTYKGFGIVEVEEASFTVTVTSKDGKKTDTEIFYELLDAVRYATKVIEVAPDANTVTVNMLKKGWKDLYEVEETVYTTEGNPTIVTASIDHVNEDGDLEDHYIVYGDKAKRIITDVLKVRDRRVRIHYEEVYTLLDYFTERADNEN